MSSIIEKLDSYEIMTNLLPGAFFGITLKFFLKLGIPVQNIGEEIVIYYFMGLIINRIGSVIIKPVLLKWHFIRELPYNEYVKATQKDCKIAISSETNNSFSTLLTCTIILPIVKTLPLMIAKIEWLNANWKWCVIIFFIIVFLFAYRKQTNFVCQRVKMVNSKETDST